MAKTRDHVITRALRKLGVVAEDEAASSAMLANASEALDSVLGEVGASALGASAWSASFPNEIANSLADLLAVELAPEYPPSQAPYPRSVAWQRFMSLARPDNRFRLPYTGRMTIVEVATGIYGYNRDEAAGALWPMLAGVRQITASSGPGVLRLIPDGREKLDDLDRLEIRFSAYQADQVLLTWDATNRDYRVTDAAVVAFLVAETSQQVTISDPDWSATADERAAFY